LSYLRKGDLVAIRRGISDDYFPDDTDMGIVIEGPNEVGKVLVYWKGRRTWIYFEDLILVSKNS